MIPMLDLLFEIKVLNERARIVGAVQPVSILVLLLLGGYSLFQNSRLRTYLLSILTPLSLGTLAMTVFTIPVSSMLFATRGRRLMMMVLIVASNHATASIAHVTILMALVGLG